MCVSVHTVHMSAGALGGQTRYSILWSWSVVANRLMGVLGPDFCSPERAHTFLPLSHLFSPSVKVFNK